MKRLLVLALAVGCSDVVAPSLDHCASRRTEELQRLDAEGVSVDSVRYAYKPPAHQTFIHYHGSSTNEVTLVLEWRDGSTECTMAIGEGGGPGG